MKTEFEIGKMDGENYGGFKEGLPVTLEIELKQKDKGETLSISGNVWKPSKTDIVSGGQCQDAIREALKDGSLKLANGYKKEEVLKLLDIWDVWHLNDMKAGCSHQRVMIQAMNHTHGEKFFYADNYSEVVKIPEFKKCSECGYKYGSAWLHEPLPEDVIEFIKGFATGKTPAPDPEKNPTE